MKDIDFIYKPGPGQNPSLDSGHSGLLPRRNHSNRVWTKAGGDGCKDERANGLVFRRKASWICPKRGSA